MNCPYCNNELFANDTLNVELDEFDYLSLNVKVQASCETCNKKFTYYEYYILTSEGDLEELNDYEKG